MYEIIKSKNFRGIDVYYLYVDNEYYSSVSEKTILHFNKNNISFNNSDYIKKYIKYNNI